VRFAGVKKAIGARRAPPVAARLFIALAAEKLPARSGGLVVVILLLAAACCVLFVTVILSCRLTVILSHRLARGGGWREAVAAPSAPLGITSTGAAAIRVRAMRSVLRKKGEARYEIFEPS
jgi:hypothetical protein